ncbi:hypothetical protein HNV27_30175 [Myxococcus xanthus]|uniref:hypothetical protein n=1 Tax=Myxococcus xanthus TaxID=34 RepID=UPI001143CD51|nr:hypothetical protein [Myxococcus xanthus]NOK05789.1 hypothetical protein [Myxococcus xanthus]
MPTGYQYLCHGYAEHPDRSFVLCEREDGHAGLHRWRDFEWDDAPSAEQEAEAELRELLRRAEQAAGEWWDE